jgi:cation diffusion facilitator family transporter
MAVEGLSLEAGGPVKARAAGLSIASNVTLIALKVVAGAVTGSVAILTEAMHSAIDLIASIVAWFSVRKADTPADAGHRYGHHKIENLAAAIEGILVLVGSGVIGFEAIRKLVESAPVEQLGFGIAVMAVSGVANLGVSTYLYRQARVTESPALEGDAAHLRTDAMTSFGVLAGLALVDITGATWLDPAVALVVAAAIVYSGLRILTRSGRVLVDEALPPDELAAIRDAVVSFGPQGVAGYHNLRTRAAGSRRYVDLHVQFRTGTTLEEAHATAHALQHAIEGRLRNADVLIHLEPEDRVRPGTEIPPSRARSRSRPPGPARGRAGAS